MNAQPTNAQIAHDLVIEAYLAQIGAAQTALARISQFLDDNGEVNPDDVNWATVGTMAHIAAQLAEIKNVIDGTVK